MGDVLGAYHSVENVAGLQDGAVLNASVSVPHLDSTIKYGKDLLTVVDVPFVWLICPMKAYGDAVHVGNVYGSPGAIRLVCASAKYFHDAPNESFCRRVQRSAEGACWAEW